MTLQYEQEAINLQSIIPVAVRTLDATTFIVDLGELSGPNAVAVILVDGGGRDPADPAANNYTIRGRLTYDNAAGTTGPGAETMVPVVTGAPIAIGGTADPSGNRMLFRINGPAFPYEHRLNFTRILF